MVISNQNLYAMHVAASCTPEEIVKCAALNQNSGL